MNPEQFIGRENEIRILSENVIKDRSSLVIGEAGVGKSALLEMFNYILEDDVTILYTTRVNPFGTFLRELFTELWQVGLIKLEGKEEEKDASLSGALKTFGRLCPNNDAKAKYLVDVLRENPNLVIVIDDASGVTPTNRPWLEQLTEHATVITSVDPKYLNKNGTKRFWKRFDEVQLERLTKPEGEELFSRLMERYRVNADEPEVYKRKVLNLAQGSPFEMQRLVKYHASETIVRTAELGAYSQNFVDRDEKGIVIAPVLLLFAALGIAFRYIARAQGDLDLYVFGGISIAVFLVLGPWLRSALKPRSSS